MESTEWERGGGGKYFCCFPAAEPAPWPNSSSEYMPGLQTGGGPMENEEIKCCVLASLWNKNKLRFQRLVCTTRSEGPVWTKKYDRCLRPCCIIVSSRSGVILRKRKASTAFLWEVHKKNRTFASANAITHPLCLLFIHVYVLYIYIKKKVLLLHSPWAYTVNTLIIYSGMWCASDTQAYCLQVSLCDSNNCRVLRGPTFIQLSSNLQTAVRCFFFPMLERSNASFLRRELRHVCQDATSYRTSHLTETPMLPKLIRDDTWCSNSWCTCDWLKSRRLSAKLRIYKREGCTM